MLEVFLRSSQTQWGAFGSDTWPTAPVDTAALPFTRWKITDVKKVLQQNIPPEYRHAWGMYHGDHWQGGWGWAGPMVPSNDPSYQRLWAEILKMFCSRNVLRDILKTHVNGVLGRPMRWSLVPIRGTADERDNTPEDLKTLIAEASVIVRGWLESRKAHELMRAFLLDLLIPPGRATLRIFVPRGVGTPVEPGSRVLQLSAGLDFAKTLAGIFVEKPSVPAGAIHTDPDTQRQIGVALFKARDANTDQLQDAASVTFLDSSGERTIVAAIYQDGTKAEVGYEMGGRLVMHQGEREPIVTTQLLQQQRILNYAESIIPRTLTTAGFLDRVIKSAQLNGSWVKDPETGVEQYVIDESQIPRFGPAEVTVLQPLVIEDDQGNIHVTEPSMDRGEPVEPVGAVNSSDHLYHNMLRESDQGHLVPGEENDSLVIKYGLSLLESAIPCNQALRWLIETGLAQAEALRGEQGKYTGKLRAQTSCYLNVGPVTPEQRASLIAAFEKSIISRETAQELMGVEDVDSENDRIAAQPGSAIDLAIRQANAFKMFREAGLPAGVAARRSGFSEDEAKEMEAEFQKQQKADQEAKASELQLQGQNAVTVAGVRNKQTGSAGLRAKRRGRPSGTAERNPGQGQDRGARALQNKARNRSQP